jgi:hypothetical protein
MDLPCGVPWISSVQRRSGYVPAIGETCAAHTLHLAEEPVQIDRLLQTADARLGGNTPRVMSCRDAEDRDTREVRILRLTSAELEAIHPWHVHIQEYETRRALLQTVQAVHAVSGGFDCVSVEGQEQLQHFTQVLVVLDNQHI